MSLIPSRSTSKKKQAAKATAKASKATAKAAKKVAKAKAVQKAPKTAVAVWTGKRSGKILKGVGIAILGAITLKAIRGKMQGGSSSNVAPAPPTFNSTPTPDPGAPAAAVNGSAPAGGVPGSAPTPDPAAPSTATPPHGDPLLDDSESAEK
jgi:hypothetical protein